LGVYIVPQIRKAGYYQFAAQKIYGVEHMFLHLIGHRVFQDAYGINGFAQASMAAKYPGFPQAGQPQEILYGYAHSIIMRGKCQDVKKFFKIFVDNRQNTVYSKLSDNVMLLYYTF
jgi:hypothetical protein